MIEKIGEEKLTKTLRSLLTFEKQVNYKGQDGKLNEADFTIQLKSIMGSALENYYEQLSDENKKRFMKCCEDENIEMMTKDDLYHYSVDYLRTL